MDESSTDLDWSVPDDDRTHFSAYLEKSTANPQIREYKAKSYDRLGLSMGDRVLDAGCGLGDDVLALAERVGPIGEAIGLDHSESLIREARRKGAEVPGASFVVGDIYEMEFATGSFDASRADRILQHLERPQVALEELVRVTRDGGRVSAIDPDWTALRFEAPQSDRTNELLDAEYSIVKHPSMGRELYRRFRALELEDLAIDPFVITTTDFRSVYDMAEIEAWLQRMEEADERTAARIKSWTESLEQADANETFFAGLPAYHVSGRVPE